MTWSGASSGEHFLASNPAPTIPFKLNALRRAPWPGPAGIPVVMASPPTVTLSAPNAATGVASSSLRAFNDGANHYVPNLVTYGGSPITAAQSVFWITNTWVEEGGTYFYIDYITDSPKHEIVVSGTLQSYRISVNGQLVTAGGSVAITADGNTYRILVDFAGVRTMRRIMVEFVKSGCKLQGLQMLTTDTLIPAPRRGPRVIVAGDSITEATNFPGSDDDGLFGFTNYLSFFTGWDCWPQGEGGIGYLQANSGAGRTNALGHIGDITNNAPDLVLWALGINDTGFTAAQVQAQCTLCFAAVSAALPQVPQIVVGPFWGNSGGGPLLNAGWLATRNAIKAAAAAAGLPFADPYGTGFLYGTGRIGNPIGDGPADFLVGTDNTHPSRAGYVALAQAIASTVAVALGG